MTNLDASHRLAAPNEKPTPGDGAIEKIEGRWTLQILLCLREGEHRFSDLRAALPRISSKVLTGRIHALQRAGFIERHYLPPPSASHVNVLASSVAGLKPALDALATWQDERAQYLW